MTTGTATCHTEGCENEGIPHEVTTEFEMDGETYRPSIMCGPCGHEITDVDEGAA